MGDNEESMDEMEWAATSIADLQTLAGQQNKNLDKLTENIMLLAHAVKDRPTKKNTYRLVVGLASAILLVNMVMFGIVLRTSSDTRSITDQLADCLTPTGQCYANQQSTNERNRVIISYRSEQFRLQTEISVAAAKGDTVAVDVRQKRLDQVNAMLDDLGSEPN